MKKMRRILALVLAMIMCASLLVACGEEEFTCEVCGQTQTGTQYTETLDGEKFICCKTCKDDLKELNDSMEELNDSLEELDEALSELEGLY